MAEDSLSFDSRERRDGKALTRRHLVGVSARMTSDMARRLASGSGGAEVGRSMAVRSCSVMKRRWEGERACL